MAMAAGTNEKIKCPELQKFKTLKPSRPKIE